MIDPSNIINYDRTSVEIEGLFIFTVAVAGKNAKTTAKAVNNFLESRGSLSPFEYIRGLINRNLLLAELKKHHLGNYTKLQHVYSTAVNSYKSGLELKTISRDDLCKIKYVKMKTASCFLGWVLPDVKYAMLDVHILRYLRGIYGDIIPKTTPQNIKKYLEIEQLFLIECGDNNPAKFDLEIWRNACR